MEAWRERRRAAGDRLEWLASCLGARARERRRLREVPAWASSGTAAPASSVVGSTVEDVAVDLRLVAVPGRTAAADFSEGRRVRVERRGGFLGPICNLSKMICHAAVNNVTMQHSAMRLVIM